ncbi:MAG: GNAT family N-acetyltransferase [Runella sp.]
MEIVTARTPAHYATAVELFEEYATWLGVDLCFQNFRAELQQLPQKYGPPTGELWLLEIEGQWVGCAALWQLAPDTCEIKRMYVKPAYQGQGWGKKLLIRAIETAQSLGYKKVKLDTLRRLTPAVALYESFGFVQTTPYNFNPEADVLYFEREV